MTDWKGDFLQPGAEEIEGRWPGSSEYRNYIMDDNIF